MWDKKIFITINIFVINIKLTYKIVFEYIFLCNKKKMSKRHFLWNRELKSIFYDLNEHVLKYVIF